MTTKTTTRGLRVKARGNAWTWSFALACSAMAGTGRRELLGTFLHLFAIPQSA